MNRVRRASSGTLVSAGSPFAPVVARVRQNAGFVALVLFVFAVYAFYVSAGTDPWPVYGVYHDLQADGFLRGQLSLPLEPAPELLKAKNPYDSVNMRYWSLDASYYKGKYYIYWGPVPALVQAAAKWLWHVRKPVGDQYVTLFFLCVGFLCGALVIRRMARRLFPGLPRWLLVAGVLAFAFANPTPHAAATASTYHAAIVAGQAWLVAGLVFAFDAVWHAGSPRATNWRLLAAGVCWALAIGSRVTLGLPVACLIPITAVAEAFASERRWLRSIVVMLWLGVPVALASAGLLFYNYLRFDHFLEFGSKLQLSGFPLLRVAPAYMPVNLYSYALRPWATSCQFPFLFQEWRAEASFPKFLLPLPAGYLSPEPVVGFMVAVPLCWLTPLAFVWAPRLREPVTRRTRAYLFCLLSFTALATVSGLVALGVYGSTMRYLSDTAYGLVLLSLLAAFGLRMHPLARHARRPVAVGVGALAAVTVAGGLLLGYQGYNGHFHRYNAELDRALVKALSFCGASKPVVPHFLPDG